MPPSHEPMRAWAVDAPGPIDTAPLRRVRRAVPSPGRFEVLVRVATCGVCRTDLHLAEGDLLPRRPLVVPGHEVVGVVVELGEGCTRVAVGDRVGVPWLARTCGTCRFCASGRENLCVAPTFRGWDVDGGYAEHVVTDERYCYAVPATFSDVEAAPLLCAGIIGYRALLRAELPEGGRLGIYGFGGSAHLTAQVAIAQGARVHVCTRSPAARELALELGAASAGDATTRHPSRSTRRSSSRRSARSCRSRSAPSTAAGLSRSPAST
jgi:propanol-preferring alcohol dehydrogenase